MKILSILKILLIMVVLGACNPQQSGDLILYNDNDLTNNMPDNPSFTIPFVTIMPYLCEGTPVWNVGVSFTDATLTGTPSTSETPVKPPLDSQSLYEALIKTFREDGNRMFDILITQFIDISMMILYLDSEYDEKSFSLLGLTCTFNHSEMAEKLINSNADMSIGKGDEFIINVALFVGGESKLFMSTNYC